MRDLRRLIAAQRGVVSYEQLRAAGWTRRQIAHAVHTGRLVRLHEAVFAVGHVPTDPLALRIAATLTHPGTALAVHSAAVHWGLRRERTAIISVVRPGSGGRSTGDGLLVLRSRTLAGEIVVHQGVPVTSAARTIIDLAGALGPRPIDAMVRDAIRLRLMTAADFRAALAKHRGRRGVAFLRKLCGTYELLQIERTRSDAEVEALALLRVHGRPMPLVNVHIAGKEADLVWPGHRLIIELDGPQWHLFKERDAAKEAIWRAAGWRVDRLPTDDVFDRPHLFLALAPNVSPSTPGVL